MYQNGLNMYIQKKKEQVIHNIIYLNNQQSLKFKFLLGTRTV